MSLTLEKRAKKCSKQLKNKAQTRFRGCQKNVSPNFWKLKNLEKETNIANREISLSSVERHMSWPQLMGWDFEFDSLDSPDSPDSLDSLDSLMFTAFTIFTTWNSFWVRVSLTTNATVQISLVVSGLLKLCFLNLFFYPLARL